MRAKAADPAFSKIHSMFLRFFESANSFMMTTFRSTFAREKEMTEKVEWEVVDAPEAVNARHQRRANHAHHARRATGEAMHAMLGRWWKWKIAGTAVVTVVTLALFATLTGALVLLFVAGTLLSVGVRKLKQWLGAGRSGTTAVKL
jgi:hypothetical protein